ncbi:MAG TPA: farnesyl diphosphate synthase [Pseudomonadales bacterium]|nr:farnesyl diphosphate synthase [Pseudomonadales bacterium]
MSSSMSFDAWLEARRGAVDDRLSALLDAHPASEARLAEACRHALLLGGKRLRPLLASATCEALGGEDAAGQTAGAAVELIHAYSLVHDDLPAMDDDVLRRGQPTVHVRYDEATAILAGDALLTLAFEVLARAEALGHLAAEQRLAMVARLAHAAGGEGMVGGQALDMAATGRAADAPALARIHAGKTGALITAAVLLGGLAADARDAGTLGALERFGTALGLAFQIVDDILDATADSATLGKTSGADAAAGKSTYVALFGIDGARARADEACSAALAALAGLPDAGRLPDFVAWVRERTH